MKELLKNKVVLVVAGVIVLLILVGGLFLLTSKKSTPTQDTANTNAIPTQIPIPTITADSIGLTLKAGTGGKTAIATVANPAGISDLEFTLTYLALVNGEDVERGVTGKLTITSKSASKEITLGTCSDVCHYDTGVKNLKLILKVTKDDGKIYQADASLSSVSQ